MDEENSRWMKKKEKRDNTPGRSWSLFLDRDGVINERIPNDYVKKVEEFVFNPGATEAIARFNHIFGKVFVVTNQQGIGKGQMTHDQLDQVHRHMVSHIEGAGGRIDKIYYCPFLAKDHPFCRKPQVGMGLQARKDFPEVSLKRSVMAGDTLNDMVFGRRLGMATVLIGSDHRLPAKFPELIDYHYENLYEFSRNLDQW